MLQTSKETLGLLPHFMDMCVTKLVRRLWVSCHISWTCVLPQVTIVQASGVSWVSCVSTSNYSKEVRGLLPWEKPFVSIGVTRERFQCLQE